MSAAEGVRSRARTAVRAARDAEPSVADYLSDTEFDDGALLEEHSKMLNTFDTVVVIDKLPQVPADKLDKLVAYCARLFAKDVGPIVEGGIFMPLGSSGMTEGFAFVEYVKAEDAKKAAKAFNGAKFDAAHELRTHMYTEFKELLAAPVTTEFVPPKPFECKTGPDSWQWLTDYASRDQFVTISAANMFAASESKRNVEVLWSDGRRPPLLDFAGGFPESDTYANLAWRRPIDVRWSPRGTYMAALSDRGVRLWSNSGYTLGHAFPSQSCSDVVFSPDERFVFTWGLSTTAGAGGMGAIEAAVWDTRTGERKRTFTLRGVDAKPDMFWTPDSKYLVRLEKEHKDGKPIELVKVYEVPTFTLADQRSIPALGAKSVSVAPKGDNIIAVWTPERENVPTSVQLLRFPSRTVIRNRSLFNVGECQLYWHPEGTHLAVVAGLVQKRRKGAADREAQPTSNAYSIEVFKLREKDVPVEAIEIKGRVCNFAWDPAGPRFSVVYSVQQPDGTSVNTVAVYSAAERTITQKLVLDKSPASEVVWNPRGEFFVLADRTKSSAVFSVYDVERKETLAELAHPGANDMSWDPSGRVFVTMKTCHAASSASEMSDNGYMLWTFQGVLLAHIKKPVLHVLRWRPRPTGLLTDEEIRDATKNYKKYQRKFEEMDKRDDERRMLLARLEKRRQLDEFRSLVSARHSAWVEDAAERAHLNIETPRYVEEEFEYLVSESVTADVQQGGGAASAL